MPLTFTNTVWAATPAPTGPLQPFGGGCSTVATPFSWGYSGPGQTGYSLKLTGSVPTLGSGTWYWTGTAWTATQTWVSSTAQGVTIPASALTAGNSYTWSLATEDTNGQGAYQ